MRAFAQNQKPAQQSKSDNLPAHMQRTLANQAVMRLLQAHAEQIEAYAATPTGFAHDFSRVPLRAEPGAKMQRSPAVGAPGDVYEREADRAAEQVMRMPGPGAQHTCACGGTCSECQAKAFSLDQELLRSSAAEAGAAGETSAPTIVEQVVRSPGQPLDAATRAFFEPRFGHTFGQVRVHTDTRAAESARAVGALAYTVGRDVVFARGRYAPESTSGRHLLAHELAHVVQQGRAQPAQGDAGQAHTIGSEPFQPAHAVALTQLSGAAQIQRQLDPNQLYCAALCAICAGTLVAPELIVPEIACAMCLRMCPQMMG